MRPSPHDGREPAVIEWKSLVSNHLNRSFQPKFSKWHRECFQCIPSPSLGDGIFEAFIH
jgi:hypothetical protein